jgi:DNA-binding MarR family transcriptional regulator
MDGADGDWRMPGQLDEPIGPLLFTCARLLDEIAQARVNVEVGERLARPALMRLLPFLDRAGIRPSELARRADVSKQAVGQTLRASENLGFIETIADPTDGRAQLIRLTPEGEAAFRYGNDVLAFLGGELGRSLGASAVRDLTRGLQRMRPVLEAWASDPPTRIAPTEAGRLRGALRRRPTRRGRSGTR